MAKAVGVIWSVPTYAENLMTMKCAAAAAGGREKAVKTIEDFYVESILMKPG